MKSRAEIAQALREALDRGTGPSAVNAWQVAYQRRLAMEQAIADLEAADDDALTERLAAGVTLLADLAKDTP